MVCSHCDSSSGASTHCEWAEKVELIEGNDTRRQWVVRRGWMGKKCREVLLQSLTANLLLLIGKERPNHLTAKQNLQSTFSHRYKPTDTCNSHAVLPSELLTVRNTKSLSSISRIFLPPSIALLLFPPFRHRHSIRQFRQRDALCILARPHNRCRQCWSSGHDGPRCRAVAMRTRALWLHKTFVIASSHVVGARAWSASARVGETCRPCAIASLVRRRNTCGTVCFVADGLDIGIPGMRIILTP
jgi:hypothetical protein